MKQSLNWIVGHSDTKEQRPQAFVPAQVPGNANYDWAVATGMPDWKKDENFRDYRWMEDCFWVYEATLPCKTLAPDESLFFVAEGIDYQYEIYLDDTLLLAHEGMFSAVEADITAYGSTPHMLRVVIFPTPKDTTGRRETREEARQSCKPAVSYGWDWHPRLIPVGIWQNAYLETRNKAYIRCAEVLYTLNETRTQAFVQFSVKTDRQNALQYVLYDAHGTVVYQGTQSTITVQNPNLWWCNGYGEPYLYRWEVTSRAGDAFVDARQGFVGFRTIAMVMGQGTWDEPADFPKTRSTAPITLLLNGVAIFAKGSNWVNPEVFTGHIDVQTYKKQIQLAQQANFNLLRCWGGAIINKDAFFELCDSHGIMVWQEFMLACNDYRDTDCYLKVLEQEAVAVIQQLRRHACLTMWCGGNELFNEWSRMTDQSMALRLLNKLCYELDPQRPFLMTSPLYGMAHGCYLFVYPDGREVFEVMPRCRQTAYTEFGIPSISNRACCLLAADENRIFPLEKNSLTEAHHAFSAWHGAWDTWSSVDTIEKYFGKQNTLDDLIKKSQWLQGEGYKCIYEEARRQKPFCSMALNWCYNEPWPTLANNSILSYPSEPKRSFADVASACRSVLASARVPHFSWKTNEMFEAELWMLNDGVHPIAAGNVTAKIKIAHAEYTLLHWDYNALAANTNQQGPTVRLLLPSYADVVAQTSTALPIDTTQEMKLILQAGEYSQTYRLVIYLA